jgi:hypothetical protein
MMNARMTFVILASSDMQDSFPAANLAIGIGSFTVEPPNASTGFEPSAG